MKELETSVKRGWARLKGSLPSHVDGKSEPCADKHGSGGGRNVATILSNTIHLARMLHGGCGKSVGNDDAIDGVGDTDGVGAIIDEDAGGPQIYSDPGIQAEIIMI